MQRNDLGLFCDIILKVWREGDSYCGMYIKEDGYFESDVISSMYDKARSKLAEYGNIINLDKYGIEGITVSNGLIPLEDSHEGVVLEEGFLFAVPYLYEPYIMLTGVQLPQRIKMNNV